MLNEDFRQEKAASSPVVFLRCDWKEDQSAISKLQWNLEVRELGVKVSRTAGSLTLEIFPVKPV